ncbi:30S ribosomal protein S17 [Fluviibacter phosphoraccumulans]|jgi:small subunit ribosomal protein S17|uniref:Small ribosomal subunit protein uS17 n=1 Tax=Fluviibacter phosphoraccumulans TaxID=1751046 RepID=A0A679IBJ6_9RHOO|nr:30S ribosomal protein S17 [Fluviibacter phosphoraccumulans]BBU68112.1 30S ribosomal protein S17 [Fluviibacter phosphoraccumulans]BBU70348.1 30S ribosomal protein S17 [Fluviibacter phosphoraccumulans]BCA66289.1 30S ribosomal protein S17 [Fluviibacter phosphoraccumulans]
MTDKTGMNRTLVGRVVSDKMQETATVLIERRVKHPMYGKVITRSKKYHAHNANNDAKMGDLVQIVECRPMSRTKTWQIAKLLERAEVL